MSNLVRRYNWLPDEIFQIIALLLMGRDTLYIVFYLISVTA